MSERRSSAKLPPPTEDYIIDLLTELQDTYADEDRVVRELREVRELKARTPIPDDYKLVDVEVIVSNVADEIFRTTAALTLNPPTIQITPAKSSDAADQAATDREYWTFGLLWQAGKRQRMMHTFQALADACLGDGGGWCKVLFAKDIWEQRWDKKIEDYEDKWENGKLVKTKERQYDEDTEAAKKGAGVPIVWLAVDVLTVLPVWHGDKLGEMIEVSERPCRSYFRKYGLTRDGEGNIVPQQLGQGEPVEEISHASKQWPKKIKWVEHWDEEWATYMIVGANNSGDPTGHIVQQWRHGYGHPPYFNAPGLMMNHWRNRKVGWSISQTKMWLTKYLAFLLTLHAQVAARDTLPPLFHEVPVGAEPILGDDGRPKAPEKWEPGKKITGRPGEKLSVVQFPQVAQALQQEIALIQKMIEDLETPRFKGDLPGMEGAGFAISQVMADARIRHDPQAQSIERCLEEVTRFVWYLVREVIGEKVWVQRTSEDTGWLGLGPEDLKDDVGLKWSLDPERPSDKLIMERYWHECIDKGTASLDQAIEAMGRNPSEVRRGRELDKIRQEPWYMAWKRQRLLEEMGLADIANAQQIALQIAQQGTHLNVGGPQAMGNTQVPDMGQLALTPGGVMPMGQPAAGNPVNPVGSVQVQTQSGVGGMTSLGG